MAGMVRRDHRSNAALPIKAIEQGQSSIPILSSNILAIILMPSGSCDLQ